MTGDSIPALGEETSRVSPVTFMKLCYRTEPLPLPPEMLAPPETAVPEFCREFCGAAGPVMVIPLLVTDRTFAASTSEEDGGVRSIARIAAIGSPFPIQVA